MYNPKLISSMKTFIDCELMGSRFYTELSQMAPTDAGKEILMGFGCDEMLHAECLMQAYYYLAGKPYSAPPLSRVVIPNYYEGLRMRMLDETEEYKKYGEYYIKAHTKYLKDLFFSVKVCEACHAMRIPSLLQDAEN